MTNYLVLRPFRTFGKLLMKGDVVPETEIRSPRLRMSEGKIIPAVSSSMVPEEFGADEPNSQVPPGENDIEPDVETEEKTKAVSKMDREELVAELTELGVESSDDTSLTALRKTLKETRDAADNKESPKLSFGS